MNEILIGLGSNLGDRRAALARALRAIEALPGTRILAVSEVVETEPWGVGQQPLFANAVARILTTLHAEALLTELKRIEADLGRREGVRYGPRVIDLDILLAGDEAIDTPELTVPHPRLAEREFALIPLLEVAPDATWPDGTPFDMCAATEGRIVRRLGAVPGYEGLTVQFGEG